MTEVREEVPARKGFFTVAVTGLITLEDGDSSKIRLFEIKNSTNLIELTAILREQGN